MNPISKRVGRDFGGEGSRLSAPLIVFILEPLSSGNLAYLRGHTRGQYWRGLARVQGTPRICQATID